MSSIRSYWDGKKGVLRDGPPIRGRWVMRDGQLVPLGNTQSNEVAAPAVRDDTILGGVESPLTGERFDSMTRYKAHLANHGYRITGGEHLTGNANIKPPQADGARIRERAEEVFHKLKNAEVPVIDLGDPIPADNLYMTRQELARWKEEERKMEPRRWRR